MKVEGDVNDAGVLVETSGASLEDDRDDVTPLELRGLLDDFDATARTVTILGQVVTTGASTRYELDNDVSVSASEFFAPLHSGQSVVDADWSGAQMDTASPALKLSLED